MPQTLEQMLANRKKLIAQEKGPLFMGLPDRWHEPICKFRCLNDHVSTMILKCDERGDCCLECQAAVCMTFPEDKDGPWLEDEKRGRINC